MGQLGSIDSRKEKCKTTESIPYKGAPTLPDSHQHQPAPIGKQSFSDPIFLGSSIALLQERFKQLQRVREMREERLQLEQPRWSPFPVAHSGHCHGQESGRMESPTVAPDTSIHTRLWPHATVDQSFELRSEADVDTSLHL